MMNRDRISKLVLTAALLTGAPGWALAQAPAPKPATTSGIYTCVNAAGKRITSDRLIAECMDREQRVMAKDGSLLRVVQPALTADERQAREEQDRKAAIEAAARADAARNDRNLMARYGNEDAHQKARESALDTVREAMRASETRLKGLEQERRPLEDEKEFYKNKPLPARLKRALDANDASVAAQRSAMSNQQAELERVNKLYDAELDRLKKLWAGALPGSLGPAPKAGAATPAQAPAKASSP